MKQKIAIIFSGFFRTFKHCRSLLLSNIIEPIDADIYFSTYSNIFATKEMEEHSIPLAYSEKDEKINIELINKELNNRVKLNKVENYDPNIYRELVKQLNLSERNVINQFHWRTLSQIHGIQKSIDLFKNGKIKDYDLVILTRPDIHSLRPINIEIINPNQISFQFPHPQGREHSIMLGPADFPHYFCDQLMIGSQDIILQLSNLWETTLEFAKNGTTLCTEAILGRYCQKYNIPFGPSDFHFHSLWREDKPIP
jgi:hypothetical protein